jgi:hypothetical protein
MFGFPAAGSCDREQPRSGWKAIGCGALEVGFGSRAIGGNPTAIFAESWRLPPLGVGNYDAGAVSSPGTRALAPSVLQLGEMCLPRPHGTIAPLVELTE